MNEDINNTSAAGSMQPNDSSLACLKNDLFKQGSSERLGDIVAKIPDLSAQINELLVKEKNSTRGVKTLIVQTIADAANGNLVVPDYVPSQNAAQKVYHFKQTHWQELDCQEFFDFVRQCCEAMNLPDSMMTNASFMNVVFEDLALYISHVCHQREAENEVWINCKNGTLRILRDGTTVLLPHSREDFFRYVLPYDFDPSAECPLWDNFLGEVLPDLTVQSVLAEGIGLCLAPGVKSEKMLVFFGHGSNGKSVILDVIESLFGGPNVSSVSLKDLTEDKRMLPEIEDKLVNISTEGDHELNASILKALVSGEPVTAYELYRGPRSMRRYARLITSFNVLPRAEATHGFYRRFQIIPFGVTIDEHKADVNLASKLKQELPGILNWVLEGLRRYLVGYRFTESKACENALYRYRLNSNSVMLFVDEACEPNGEIFPIETNGTLLYNGYKRFCNELLLRPLGRNNFYEQLVSLGIQRTDKQRTALFNIKLNSEYENSYGYPET